MKKWIVFIAMIAVTFWAQRICMTIANNMGMTTMKVIELNRAGTLTGPDYDLLREAVGYKQGSAAKLSLLVAILSIVACTFLPSLSGGMKVSAWILNVLLLFLAVALPAMS